MPLRSARRPACQDLLSDVLDRLRPRLPLPVVPPPLGQVVIPLDLAGCVRSGLAAEPHEVFDRIICSMYERAHRPGPWSYGPAVRGWLVVHGYASPELNSQVSGRILEV